MKGHEHEWSPVPLHCGRYTCPCGAHGYRARQGIRQLRRNPSSEVEVSVRHRSTGGRVARLPMLDEIEQRLS